MVNLAKEYNDIIEDNISQSWDTSIYLGTEGHGVIATISEFAKSKFNGISNIFKSNSEDRLDKEVIKNFTVQYKQLMKMGKTCEKVSKEVPYEVMSRVFVPSLVGQKITSVNLTNNLINAFKVIAKNLDDVLDKLDTTLSYTVSDKEYASAQKIDKKIIPKVVELKEIADKVISDSISPALVHDKQEFKKLYENMRSLHTTYDNLKELNKYAGKKTVGQLTDRVKNITDLSRHLYTLIETEEITISVPMLRHLSELLTESAKMVTGIVTLHYVINQLTMTLITTIDRAEEIGKQTAANPDMLMKYRMG